MDADEVSYVSSNSSSSSSLTKHGSLVLRFTGAIVCLLIAITSWVVLAETLQGLFQRYPQPYFMVYWIHSWYSVLYIFWKFWREFPGGCKCNSVGDGALSWKKALWTSGVIGLVGLVSAYFWYLSLSRTSVPANTAIYQSAVAFTFVLSVPILREKITLVKISAVLFAMGGVTLVALYSENSENDKDCIVCKDENDMYNDGKNCCTVQTPLGYVYLVISTILYALMEVLFKRIATIENDPASGCNGMRFVGLMGLHSFLWMWPPLFILHYSGLEVFHWPPLDVLWKVFLNAIMDVIFNGALFICVALSSPLFATIGTVTAIPISIIVDYIINRKVSNILVYIGMLLIGVGFVKFCISEVVHLRQKSKRKKDEDLIDGEIVTVINSSINNSKETDSLLGKKKKRNKNIRHYVLKYII